MPSRVGFQQKLLRFPMTYVVKLYVGGKVFEEEVQATNPKDARETALARNPKAKVVGVNVRF
jgi:hypothetical protein